MFAPNRTDSVPGRITFLTVSIITITGIRGPGVPEGTRCANSLFAWYPTDHTILPSHMGRARVRVIDRCLVQVKI